MLSHPAPSSPVGNSVVAHAILALVFVASFGGMLIYYYVTPQLVSVTKAGTNLIDVYARDSALKDGSCVLLPQDIEYAGSIVTVGELCNHLDGFEQNGVLTMKNGFLALDAGGIYWSVVYEVENPVAPTESYFGYSTQTFRNNIDPTIFDPPITSCDDGVYGEDPENDPKFVFSDPDDAYASETDDARPTYELYTTWDLVAPTGEEISLTYLDTCDGGTNTIQVHETSFSLPNWVSNIDPAITIASLRDSCDIVEASPKLYQCDRKEPRTTLGEVFFAAVAVYGTLKSVATAVALFADKKMAGEEVEVTED